MRIAVNTRFLLQDYLEGYGYFLYEVWKRITVNHPEHEFIFIFDRPFDARFIFSTNITAVVTGPPARHPLLWKLWYDVKVPAVLKKYKADVFVSCDGFCSLSASIPQCLVVHDLSFLHFPKFIPRSHLFYFRRYLPKFLVRANAVATVSEFSKKDIIHQYKVPADKINVVYSAAKEQFGKSPNIDNYSIKNKYTDGREFFLYTGAIHPRKNLLNLLKAFSIFKKKLNSNMKLVLAGRLAWKYNSFMESLKSYKYRSDVVVTGYLPEGELSNLTAAAYAMVYPSLWEGFGVPVLEAMRSEVPVITSSASAMQEIAGDAALYADPQHFHELADQMMKLYKDERLRNELIAKGKMIESQYTWDRTANLLWEAILKAVR
jgi:glycosyltransferase involved in cell wall biosynthesis